MKLLPRFLIRSAAGFTLIGLLHAQEPVVAASNRDALFKSWEPALQAKQDGGGIFHAEAIKWALGLAEGTTTSHPMPKQ